MPTPITTNPTTAAAVKPAAAPKAAGATSKLDLDSDAFLKLLIAQLKHQNPANPLEPTEMMAQTAQLAVVDRIDQMVKVQETAAKASQVGLAASLIGKTATYIGDDGQQRSGTVASVAVTTDAISLVIGTSTVKLDSVIGIKPAEPAD